MVIVNSILFICNVAPAYRSVPVHDSISIYDFTTRNVFVLSWLFDITTLPECDCTISYVMGLSTCTTTDTHLLDQYVVLEQSLLRFNVLL